MKFAIVILAVVAAASAQYNPGQYNPFQQGQQYRPYKSYNNNPYSRYNTPVTYRPFVPVSTVAPPVYSSSTRSPPVVPLVAKVYNQVDSQAQILKFGNEQNPDGSYNYFYETENGIAAQEQGVPRNLGGNPPAVPVVASGSYSFITPEGLPVTVTYTADENGYQPQSNVLPTPPPIPPQIARALEYIARNGGGKK